MTKPEQSDTARVGYRVTGDPDGRHGQFELMMAGDGAVVLRHLHRGAERIWTARADEAVWPRLVDALRGSGFPGTDGSDPSVHDVTGPVRDLMVDGVEPAGAVRLHDGDVAATGLTDAVRILDSLVHQASGGAFPGEGTLPLIVHGVTAAGQVNPSPTPTAVVGVLEPRRVAAVLRPDGGVSVIGVPAGTPVAELAPSPSPPLTVAFGDTGRPHRPQPVILTGGDDGVIRLWTPRGGPLAQQVRHSAPISAVTTSIDEDKLQVWSADLSGRLLQRSLLPGVMVLGWPPVPGPPAGITALGWAGTAAYQVLVMGLDDGRVVRRAVRAPNDMAVWSSHEGPVRAIALIGADDDFLIASAGADRVIRIRAGLAGTPWPDLPGHDATVTGLSFGLVGERLVLGSCALDGTARTWDPETGEVLARWPVGDDWPAGIADARIGDTQRWVTGGADGVVRVWDAATGACVHELRPDDDAASAVLCVGTALLPGMTLIAAGHQDGTFRLWNAADGSPVGVDRSSTEPLTSVEFGRDGRLVAFICGTLAGSVHVYDASTAELARVLTPHAGRVLSVAFGRVEPDDVPVIVSGGSDRVVRVWAGRSGWPLLHLTGHTDAVAVVALGVAGDRAVVASGGYDGTLRLWDLGTGEELRRLAVTGSAVRALAFGVTGGETVIATGGHDDAVRVFRAADGNVLLTTDPVPGLVTSVVVGAWHGIEVVAVAAGGGVRCWTLPAGAPVPTATSPWPPLAVAFGAGGELLAVGSGGVAVIDPSRPDERG